MCNTTFSKVNNLELKKDLNKKYFKKSIDNECTLEIIDKHLKNKNQNHLSINKKLLNCKQTPIISDSVLSNSSNTIELSFPITTSIIQKNLIENISVDKIAVMICMTTRSARMFITANIENLSTEYPEIMFNLPEKKVLYYNSSAQFAVGIMTCIMLLIYALTSYTKRYKISFYYY